MSDVSAASAIETNDGIATFRGLEGVFDNIIQSLLFVAGILLFITLLSGGIKYISSGGDPKSLEGAKQTITYAIIGIVFISMGYLILVLIGEITGNRNLLNFVITR